MTNGDWSSFNWTRGENIRFANNTEAIDDTSEEKHSSYIFFTSLVAVRCLSLKTCNAKLAADSRLNLLFNKDIEENDDEDDDLEPQD